MIVDIKTTILHTSPDAMRDLVGRDLLAEAVTWGIEAYYSAA